MFNDNNDNPIMIILLILLFIQVVLSFYMLSFPEKYFIEKKCLSDSPTTYTIINPSEDIPEITFKTCPGCNNNIPEERNICPVCNYDFTITGGTENPGESQNPDGPDNPGWENPEEPPIDDPPSADLDAPPPVEPGTSSLKNTIFIALILFICLQFFL